MLSITRKPGEAVHIGPNIVVLVKRQDRGGVQLLIEAPDDLTILRSELVNDETRPLLAQPRRRKEN